MAKKCYRVVVGMKVILNTKQKSNMENFVEGLKVVLNDDEFDKVEVYSVTVFENKKSASCYHWNRK